MRCGRGMEEEDEQDIPIVSGGAFVRTNVSKSELDTRI